MGKDTDGEAIRWLCQHGPVGNCLNRGDSDFLGSDVSELRETEKRGKGRAGVLMPTRSKSIVAVLTSISFVVAQTALIRRIIAM